MQERRVLEGEKYGKFEEDIETTKTYGTMGDNGVAASSYHANQPGFDNPGFQESSFTEYPGSQQQVVK